MPPKAKTSWADLPDLTVSVSRNLIRRSVKVGEGMMEPPPVNHSTHPTKQGSTEDKAGAKKKKKPEPENPSWPLPPTTRFSPGSTGWSRTCWLSTRRRKMSLPLILIKLIWNKTWKLYIFHVI